MNTDLTRIIREALITSIAANDYSELLKTYAQEGSTTGPEATESRISFTKLNAQRSKRIAKTVELDSELLSMLEDLDTPQTWLVLTESWCGDAANSIPVLHKIAESSSRVELKLVLRDENLEFMDQFLTNGGRSIPKLIALDSENNVLFTWGPRPAEAQKMFVDWKENGVKPYEEFQIDLQKWYNGNKGLSIQKELKTLLQELEPERSNLLPV